jgi:hypothetical protein
MDQGIQVFGSASMGALRAAELHHFGMQGVGRIFEAYRDGRLEDDDEVAVLHAPAEAGFLPLSDPMVNLRATLDEAERQGVVDAATAGLLTRLAKQRFYQDRRWPDLLQDADKAGVDDAMLAALKTWLPDHRADQKAIDALSMIEAMVACLERGGPAPVVEYHFEWTEMWDEVVKANDLLPPRHAGGSAMGEAILEEARLGTAPSDPLYRLALLRHLAASDRSSGERGGNGARAISAFREQKGLFRRADLDRWLEEQHLDLAGFERLMRDEAAIDDRLSGDPDRIGRHLLDQLRLDDRYQALAERASAKQAHLAALGQTAPGHAGFPLSPPELRAWYFERRLNQPMPDDIERHARSLGFADRRHFDQALRREYLYVAGAAR